MEAGDERDGEEALGVHLSPQEEVALQIVEAEVVFTAGAKVKHKTGMTEQPRGGYISDGCDNICSTISLMNAARCERN